MVTYFDSYCILAETYCRIPVSIIARRSIHDNKLTVGPREQERATKPGRSKQLQVWQKTLNVWVTLKIEKPATKVARRRK